jgi:hypothetical protein
MTTQRSSLFVHRGLDVKNWLLRPPTVKEARPGRCPQCQCASRPTGEALGLHGHGLRDRQVLGPPEVGLAATMTIVACRRYLCTACGTVVMVVPRGIEPRRHYGRAAICLALALWALAGQPTTVVRTQVCAWPGRETTSWRTLRRWAAAVASGAWPWCRAAAGLDARAAAARAAQIAASLAPSSTPGPLWARAYAGGAALV